MLCVGPAQHEEVMNMIRLFWGAGDSALPVNIPRGAGKSGSVVTDQGTTSRNYAPFHVYRHRDGRRAHSPPPWR
jgi:hypothetical protein